MKRNLLLPVIAIGAFVVVSALAFFFRVMAQPLDTRGVSASASSPSSATPNNSDASASHQWYVMSPDVWAEYMLNQIDLSVLKCTLSGQSPKTYYDADAALGLSPTIDRSYNADGSLAYVTMTAGLPNDPSQREAYKYFTSLDYCQTYWRQQAQQQGNQTKDLQ